MTAPREILLETSQGRLAGLEWRRDHAPRVLCLHGWLDNAASFIPLSEHLGQLDLVALDLPGHGLSEHRHPTARYHFIDYLFNVDAALESLGWKDCHLLGHSLGAAISAVYSAGAPERVRSIVLLDSMGPVSDTAEGTADRLRRSLVKNRRGASKVRHFDSIDQMVQARRTVSGMSETAARLICTRAARQVNGHFEWRSDPALNWVSSIIMTDEQALDLIKHVKAPALTLTATEESPWSSRAKLEQRKRAMSHARHETLRGHHHFHMDAPGEIAETVQQFIIENDQPPQRDSNEQAD
ncbi:MAG: alpha/beta fold hydrolase [Xanthomonadales bacterium]|nr:alpha/beta hydrolase [Gammaproteobacteria bacterium]MBT8054230.1 alpha/beta hydrolase [Gammaproteobacteria bacterium]NND57577.1 alpha/beta fold hydrolase [Xanthomonadales bacterium]NNK51301.1 alpha/beta fold hydrolase [Xanthomonadales bacterium]